MSDVNNDFTRALLREVMDEIKLVTTAAERKAAWVYHFHRDHWEFHGPDRYYWHGRAYNAYEARAKGWSAWWNQLKTEGNAEATRRAGEHARALGLGERA